MASRLKPLISLLVALAFVGCQERQGVSTTTGSVTIGCDEAVLPVMKTLVDDFHRSYPEAAVTLVTSGAREAIVNFINDSVRVIVSARPFNQEERAALEADEVEYREYNVALDGVAVILNRSNTTTRLRESELDSILSGRIRAWYSLDPPVPVRIAIGGLNSSTNEIVNTTLLSGRGFSPSAEHFESSLDVMEFVETHQGAIGIVGLSWLHGSEDDFTVVNLGDPNSSPDSTQLPGSYYSPAQANIYRGYYPLSTKVYIYNRELLRTVGLGFISYANNIAGQRIFQGNGLVPATMPVRLVRTTSKQVNEQ